MATVSERYGVSHYGTTDPYWERRRREVFRAGFYIWVFFWPLRTLAAAYSKSTDSLYDRYDPAALSKAEDRIAQLEPRVGDQVVTSTSAARVLAVTVALVVLFGLLVTWLAS